MPVRKTDLTPHKNNPGSSHSATSVRRQQKSGSANQTAQTSELLHALLQDFLDDRALAELLNISEKTPAQWRHLGKFPELPFYKFGRCVRYRREDVEAYIAKMRVGNTLDTAEE